MQHNSEQLLAAWHCPLGVIRGRLRLLFYQSRPEWCGAANAVRCHKQIFAAAIAMPQADFCRLPGSLAVCYQNSSRRLV